MGTTRKRSAGSGTVLARSNGTFTAQITDAIEGRRRSIGTFATRKDAEKALAVALVEGPPPSLTLTLGDYLGLFIADCALTLKATTLARYHSCLRAYIEPHPIARKRIANLRPDDFRSLYRDLADHGKRDGSPLAPASIATVDRMLKASLQRLVDDRTLIFHPIPRRVIRVPRTERPWLNLEQVRDLLRFARFVAPDLEVPLRLAALAGLRRGEVLGLRWTDIDLEGAAAQIRCSRSAAGGIAVESTPKTAGSMAQVALDPETVAALRRHQGRRAAFIETDVGATEYVVCNFDGTGLDPNRLGKSFPSGLI